MKVPGLGAYGAIAVADLQTGGCHDLEPDPPAVAASAVRDHRRCRLTNDFAAWRAGPLMKRGACRRVRQHRHVRRRYLARRGAARAKPTKKRTTAGSHTSAAGSHPKSSP